MSKKSRIPETPAEPKASLTLNIKERLGMSSLFPQQGNLISQIVVKDIAEKIQINQEEIREVGLRDTPQGGLAWNPKKDKVKTYQFTQAEITFLREQVSRLDTSGAITQDNLTLCLKIKDSKKE